MNNLNALYMCNRVVTMNIEVDILVSLWYPDRNDLMHTFVGMLWSWAKGRKYSTYVPSLGRQLYIEYCTKLFLEHHSPRVSACHSFKALIFDDHWGIINLIEYVCRVTRRFGIFEYILIILVRNFRRCNDKGRHNLRSLPMASVSICSWLLLYILLRHIYPVQLQH